MRLRVPLWLTPDMIDERARGPAGAARRARPAVDAAASAKFFADGVIDAGHGLAGGAGHARRGHDAVLARPAADGARRSSASPRAGFQLATHTIGDAAVRFTLDTYLRGAGRHAPPAGAPRDAAGRPRRGDRRVRRDRLDAAGPPRRAARPDGNWNERLGPERAARALPHARPDRRRRRARARQRLAGGGRRPAARHWPPAAADASALPDQALTAHEALAGYTLAPPTRPARRPWPGASASGCAPTSPA